MKNNNDVQRFLAATLALILVAGIGTPAFALDGATPSSPGPGSSSFAKVASTDPIVFESSSPDLSQEVGWRFDSDIIPADDFNLDEDAMISDFHFIMHLPDSFVPPLNYIIYSDTSGNPDVVLDSGIAQNVVIMPIPDSALAEVWFDLEEPFPADAAITYWFGINCPGCSIIGWQFGIDDGFGNPLQQFFGGEWQVRSPASWFALSAKENVVGGELLPIDTTALLLAGAQVNSVWILSALAVIGSVAFGTLYLTTKRF